MNPNCSPAFQGAMKAWTDAYAAHDAIASSRDRYEADHSPAAQAAGDLEYRTLEELLMLPAATPADVAEKLRVIRERDINAGWTDDYPRYMAQIEADLSELARPGVSPAMRERFEVWRQSNIALMADAISDEEAEVANDEHSAAFIALMETSCVSPGDFLVKIYVELLGELGPTSGTLADGGRGFAFEVHDRGLTEGKGTNDGAAALAVHRDIDNCDLGRCLLALGRVDFDAEAWISAASRAEMAVILVVQKDGSRALYLSHEMLSEPDSRRTSRQRRCLALLNKDRRRAVAAAIEVHHLEMIFDTRLAMEIAA